MFNTIWGYIAWAALTAVLTVAVSHLWDWLKNRGKGDEQK